MTVLSYRPDIDGLRAVAVLAVVLNHLSHALLPGGYVGVDVFFVISGYLITSIISREITAGNFTFSDFYERRARRIFPALFAMLLTTLVVSYIVFLPSDLTATLRGAISTVFFASNMLFWREMQLGYFAETDVGLNPLLHTWSLSVEEQFYVFFPILLLLCFKYARQKVFPILIICGVISLALADFYILNKSAAVFFLAPFRAWELLIGAILALNVLPALRTRYIREIIATFGLLLIALTCLFYSDKTNFPGIAALLPVFGAAFIIYTGASGSTWVGRLLSLKPVVLIGLISYSLYLWHWPIIVLFRYVSGVELVPYHFAGLLAASLFTAYLSYKFIEKPFRSKTVFNRQFLIILSITVILSVTLFAALGLHQKGFETKHSKDVVLLDKARAPEIPFLNCDVRKGGEWCHLRHNSTKEPSILFYGDSHLLAWAPAFDVVMRETQSNAVFVPYPSCVPVFGTIDGVKPACVEHNKKVQLYIANHPNIKKVVMSAAWSGWIRHDTPTIGTFWRPTTGQAPATATALRATIQWMRDRGIEVVLIGPVPVHAQNVPIALALEKSIERRRILSTDADQREKNEWFFKVLNSAKAVDGPTISFLDPIAWMCKPNCEVMTQENAIAYRDSNHLNVEGAMAHKEQLKAPFLKEAMVLLQ